MRLAFLVSISKLPDDVIVGESGSVEINLGYVRGSVRWSGMLSDLESLTFQTYDTGEGNVNYFVIKIRGKGDVLLRICRQGNQRTAPGVSSCAARTAGPIAEWSMTSKRSPAEPLKPAHQPSLHPPSLSR